MPKRCHQHKHFNLPDARKGILWIPFFLSKNSIFTAIAVIVIVLLLPTHMAHTMLSPIDPWP